MITVCDLHIVTSNCVLSLRVIKFWLARERCTGSALPSLANTVGVAALGPHAWPLTPLAVLVRIPGGVLMAP